MTESRWLFPLALALSTAALFANTFSDEFVYDDKEVVLDNPQITYWHFLDLLHLTSRSIRTLSLMIDYHIFGYAPAGYHFQNILWHLLAVLLLYKLFLILSGSRILSFAGALLFSIHPIHVESVANIANRKDPLCMAFSLFSFISYIRFLAGGDKKKWPWFFISLFGGYLALNSKQVAVALPLSFIAYEYVFLKQERRFLAKNHTLLFAGFISGIAAYIFLLNQFGYSRAGFSGETSIHAAFITSAEALLSHIKLLLFPLNLSPDYVIALSESITDPIVILQWISVGGILLLPFYLVKRAPLVSFGLFWLLVHYIPVSSLVPGTYIVADRYMYIPSAGFCLLFVAFGKLGYDALSDHFNGQTAKGLTLTLATIIVVALTLKTVTYNRAWQSNFKLWNHAIGVTKSSSMAYKGRGGAYSSSGNHVKAIEDFSSAIELDPFSEESYNNRGIEHFRIGNYNQAVNDLNKAIELSPLFEEAFYNRGITHKKLGNCELAIKDYSRAIDLSPRHVKAFYNRALCYGTLDKHDQAFMDFNRVITINPRHAEAYFGRGAGYGNKGNYQMALIDFQKSIEINPGNASAYYSIGLIKQGEGNNKEALTAYKKAASLGLDAAKDKLINFK